MEKREIRDIAISWLLISIAFAYPGVQAFLGLDKFVVFLESLAIILVAAGTGFVFHELAHKYVSIRFGVHAEYFAWPSGLVFALILAFFTNGAFTFAAPGAVYIFGPHVSAKRSGIVSVAGPLTNIVVGIAGLIAFFALLLSLPNVFLLNVAMAVFRINFLLAAFNMLPIPPLDGSKVFAWNPLIWAAVFVPALVVGYGLPLLF